MPPKKKRALAPPAEDEAAASGEQPVAQFALPRPRPDPEESNRKMISWEVDGVSGIDDNGKNSSKIVINGIKWYIRVRTERSERTANETCLSVYIYCQSKNLLDVWYADVLADVRLLHRRDEKKDKKERFSYRFTRMLTNSGYASFIKMTDLVNANQGFIHENKVKLEAAISVMTVHGMSPAPELRDFSSPVEHLTDGVLVVEGAKLHVSKQFLALSSPVFEAMFYRGFKEARQEEVVLEEVDHDEFVELLNVLYTPDRDITPTSCNYLLKLADRFQIKSVLKRAEHFLCTCFQFPDFLLASRLRMADEYKLYEAQHAILHKLTKLADITSMKNQRDYVPLSDTMKLMVADLQLKLQPKP